LSEFGTTSTDQNVELRTLAGQPVHLRDGGETPYVSQITSNTTISGAGAGVASDTVEFETVDTGLTLDLTPNFDAGSGIVTVDVSMNVEDIESFLSLPSGVSGVDIERPVTSNRELTDLVRVAAGETVILGGITKISKSDDRNAPLEFWTIGSDNSETDRVALFIILRPFVTIYELDGNIMGEEPHEKVASAPIPERPASEPLKPAARIVQQSLTGSDHVLTGSSPVQAPIPAQPAPIPTPAVPPRPTANAEPEMQEAPSSLVTAAPVAPPAAPVQAVAPVVPPRPTASVEPDMQAAPSSLVMAAPVAPPAAPVQASAPAAMPVAPATAPVQAMAPASSAGPTTQASSASGESSGYFNDLVGKILVSAPQQQ
jgi:hypothetical protein